MKTLNKSVNTLLVLIECVYPVACLWTSELPSAEQFAETCVTG